MEIRWRSSPLVSAIHVAYCIAGGRQLTCQLSEDFRQSCVELNQLPTAFHTQAWQFWSEMLTCAGEGLSRGEFAKLLLRRCGVLEQSRPGLLPLVSGLIANLELSFAGQFPKFSEEIRLRSQLLEQLWMSYGPGLMHSIGRQTESELIVESAQVFVLQPIVGGAGYATLRSNRAYLEGILANVQPVLPEYLRLAHLVAQLDFERPVFSELIHGYRLPLIAGLSTLPATLRAAEELGLCAVDEKLLTEAVRLWVLSEHQESPITDAQVLAMTLNTWWETYQASRPAWRVALTALERMIFSAKN